jgi:hypothetical protein
MLRQHTPEPKASGHSVACIPIPNHLWDLIDWLAQTLSQATWVFKKLLHWPLGEKGWYIRVWEINLKHTIRPEWDFRFQSSKTENPWLAWRWHKTGKFVVLSNLSSHCLIQFWNHLTFMNLGCSTTPILSKHSNRKAAILLSTCKQDVDFAHLDT